jgi:acyl-CoA synthetase (AMP-forming)/AMP-acid ligase II
MAYPGRNRRSFDPSQVASHRRDQLQYISVDSYRVEPWSYPGFPCHVRAGSVRAELKILSLLLVHLLQKNFTITFAMLINMGRLLRQTALCFSDRTALVNIERNRRFTFWQLHELTNKLCNLIKEKFGLYEGDVYATLLENDNMGLFHFWMTKSPVTALWLDIRESVEEQLNQIDYVQPRLIFIEAKLLSQYYEHLSNRDISIVCMDETKEALPNVHYFWDLLDEASSMEPSMEYVLDDVAQHICLLKFTGGTTGRAKCVMFSLSNILSPGCNPVHYYEVLPFDYPKALLSSPITHVASGQMVIPVYLKGGTVVTTNKADIERMGRIIEQEKIDFIYTIPTVLYRMLDTNMPREYDLSSLKTIRYGASPISPSKLESLLKEFGQIFVQGYASTECWPPATVLARKDHGTDTEEQIKRLGSVGQPVPCVEIRICDDNGQDLPVGEKGEIWIRGPNTVKGYFKDPEQTMENFSANGFWKSGDIGFIDDKGYVFLVDRKKDMIVSGGYNVYATEVENCINRHPAVQSCAVVGIPDEYWGEAVCGVVVLRKGEVVQQQALIDHCKQHLARYKAPKKIDFVDALPLSPVGKVLRREIKKKFWAEKGRGIH